MNFLKGKKTYLVSLLMILGSLGSVIAGDITLAQFFTETQVLEAFGLAALRNGIR